MAVSSFSNSGIRSGVKRNKFWDQSAVENSFFSIETVTLGSNQLQIDFTSIPQTYTHLQLRVFARNTEATTDSAVTFRFNDDSGSNYSSHHLRGNGSAAYSGNSTNATKGFMGWVTGSSSTSSAFGVIVFDILDYTNTNKYKTAKSLNGYDGNGSGQAVFYSSNWRSTSAITKISITADDTAGRNFVQYSSFALYGIKG